MNVSAGDIANLISGSGTVVTIREDEYETPLSELGIDSLDVATIFLAIQEKFDVIVSDDEIDELTTVNLIADRVTRELDGR